MAFAAQAAEPADPSGCEPGWTPGAGFLQNQVIAVERSVYQEIHLTGHMKVRVAIMLNHARASSAEIISRIQNTGAFQIRRGGFQIFQDNSDSGNHLLAKLTLVGQKWLIEKALMAALPGTWKNITLSDVVAKEPPFKLKNDLSGIGPGEIRAILTQATPQFLPTEHSPSLRPFYFWLIYLSVRLRGELELAPWVDAILPNIDLHSLGIYQPESPAIPQADGGSDVDPMANLETDEQLRIVQWLVRNPVRFAAILNTIGLDVDPNKLEVEMRAAAKEARIALEQE